MALDVEHLLDGYDDTHAEDGIRRTMVALSSLVWIPHLVFGVKDVSKQSAWYIWEHSHLMSLMTKRCAQT